MKKQIKAYNKNFILIAIGQIISTFGASLFRFALSLYILDVTRSCRYFCDCLRNLYDSRLLMPLGGAIADRFNRAHLMVMYDITSSFIILCLFLLISIEKSAASIISITMIMLSIISTMYTPALNASIPSLVDKNDIESANGIVTAIQASSDVIAPILGGILYKLIVFIFSLSLAVSPSFYLLLWKSLSNYLSQSAHKSKIS